MKKIGLSFFIFLIFFAQVVITDTIIYFLRINYIIANIIAIVPNIILTIFLIRKKLIKIENKFNKWDIVFFTLLLIVTSLTIVFPDEFWDTYSYHIYIQEEPFEDKIHEDFFPGRTLTSFVFPIVDRVFYMFRSLLGFRLGTLPSYLILIVMFYQVKKILKLLTKKDIEEKYISLLSILPLCVVIILRQMGTYYIDNFSIVILLEIIYTILYDSDELFKNRTRIYYLALLVGIGVCIKLTNAIYMILPLIYVLIKNTKDIKQIKWFDYILLLVTAFIPMLPYFIDSLIQTGNPVFPYYNSIFKSEYFAEINWLDDYFGPKNIIEFLIWPLYIIKYPTRAYEADQPCLPFAIGYILVIAYLIYLGYKKVIKKEKLELTTNTIYILNLLYFYLVWAKFIIGYIRYAGIIPILATIFIIKLLIESIDKNNIITLLLSTVLAFSAIQGISQYETYSAIPKYMLALKGNKEAKENIKDNINKVLDDRKYPKYDIDGIWGVIYDDSAIPTFLNVDDKLVHLEYGVKTGQSEKSDALYWENVLNNNIYVPICELNLDGKLSYLDSCHFEVIEMVDIIKDVSFLQGESKIYIVKVKYTEEMIFGNKAIFKRLLREYK